MNMKDKELINNFCEERNLKQSSRYDYKMALKSYSEYYNITLQELINEAEEEENQNIKWKNTKLRKRLIEYRNYLSNNDFRENTVKIYVSRIKTFYSEGFDIEIGKLPRLNTKNINKSEPISYKDLPDKELIKEIVKIVPIKLEAIILFMSSSGCARRETLNITIQDFINATKPYHNSKDIYEVLEVLKTRDDVVPSWKLKRQKTNKYYTTFSSPESTKSIISYLQSETITLKPENKLFRIAPGYLNIKFIEINNQLNLGTAGTYNRFRSHMLRKFHASQLYNDGLSIDEIDELQGRGKDKTRTSYFLEDPDRLREKYIEHLNAITINSEVENLTIKSEEYIQLENDLLVKDEQIKKYDERLSKIEKFLSLSDNDEKDKLNSIIDKYNI